MTIYENCIEWFLQFLQWISNKWIFAQIKMGPKDWTLSWHVETEPQPQEEENYLISMLMLIKYIMSLIVDFGLTIQPNSKEHL